MIANLYLHPDTFKYNNTDSFEEISNRFRVFVRDISIVITDFKDKNRFRVSSSLMSVHVYTDLNIVDLAEKCLEADFKGLFYSMLYDTSEAYDVDLSILREKCHYHPDEKEVNSLLVFNVPQEDLTKEDRAQNEREARLAHQSIIKDYITFDDYSIVYSRDSWIKLRRQILGNHPVSPSVFISESTKYFPKLCFHNNCITSLVDEHFNYLDTSSRKIVYYLSCLNDKFCDYYTSYTKDKGCDPNAILEGFSGVYSLDEPGSIQANPGKKSLLTFDFRNNDGTFCSIVCEPHLKIAYTDSNYTVQVDSTIFHPRIYFGFPKESVEHGRIPVGSIGRHV